MLEFEENAQVPMRAEVVAPTGFVVIPVDEYNRLLLAAEAANQPPVKVGFCAWSTYPRIDATIDKGWLYKHAIKALHEKYSEEELAKFDIIGADDIYIGTATIASANAETRAAIDATKQMPDKVDTE